MSANLTTVFLVRQYADITDTSAAMTARLQRLIDQVVEAMERLGQITFAEATYKSWLNGTGKNYLLLDNWPVTRLYRVATARNDAIRSLTYSGSGTHADVSVTSSAVELHWLDAAAAEHTSSVTFSGNATIADLGAALNAVSDWGCQVQAEHNNEASALLRPIDGAWAVSPDDVDLEIPDEGVNARIDPDTNRMITGPCFPAGVENVFAWYKAGYALKEDDVDHTQVNTEGTVPDGLTLATNMIVKDVFDLRQHDDTLRSEKLGDYSYATKDIDSVVLKHWVDLVPYVNVEI